MENEWFKCMRDLTPEEQAAVNEQIRKISKPTGVTLEGILNGETYIPHSQIEKVIKDNGGNMKIEEVLGNLYVYDARKYLEQKKGENNDFKEIHETLDCAIKEIESLMLVKQKLERIQQVVYLDWLNENMSAEDCMAQIEWIIELGDEEDEPTDCKND